ncbi:acyl-CoA dehydrogenase family protein [Nocardiopsis sediminis]|uniref:Acyl-CoA dehydrogenase family protein n=1 Tax=Nocardiopsis sediminis TaxID=1778267 RepID=A0ABV8FP70_9ACTN
MDTEREFRDEVRTWLAENLVGDFAAARGLGGPGRDHEAFDVRLAWERHMAAAGWTCLGWPVEYGGRGAGIERQVAFHEEYARADAPARVNHIGEHLLGPTLIAFGSPAQRARYLPAIAAVRELWCQGYSEPGAGSDLAAVATRARPDPGTGGWVVDGRKIWTSHAREAHRCFVLARTEPGSRGHRGLGYLLVPMDAPGVEVRPITQLTGTSEFNEVVFDGVRTGPDALVGEPGDGWRIAMATLGFERGVSTLGLQVGYERELRELIRVARDNGAAGDPLIRDRLTRAWIGVRTMRYTALRTMAATAAGAPGPEASIGKLFWARWHRDLGELAMDVIGAPSMLTAGTAGDAAPEAVAGADPGVPEGYDLDRWQRLFLFSRADTIYAGTDEIQRNVIAERVLGLPREPRPAGPPA